jgi:predicted metal-dependent hydrolase
MLEIYHAQDGTRIAFRLYRRARKNLILRIETAHVLSISVPPRFSMQSLQTWLRANEAVVLRYWRKAQQMPSAQTWLGLPEKLWYQGVLYPIRRDGCIQSIQWCMHQGFAVPENHHADADYQAAAALHVWLKQAAQASLLPRLHAWADNLALTPAGVGLSSAKTFWGVCRARTGIRLNWRLIGAPDWVVDYVCIHELCHLPHPNHSLAFWALVRTHTPHVDAAKDWLKMHGPDLFQLDAVVISKC